MNFDFIKSNRFWAAVIGAVSMYLESKGIIGQAEMILIASIMAAHIGIRTVDRFAEKNGGADTK